MSDAGRPAKGRRRTLATLGRLLLLVAVLIVLNQTLGGYFRTLGFQLSPEAATAVHRGLILTCLLYALLLAIPFVPGVEIGIGLLTVFGASVALHVYAATVLGLSIAFLAGRLIPLDRLARLARGLRMRRTAALLRRIEPLPREARLAALTEGAPNAWVPFLIRHRYVALAAALNIPGNALIGGGGGLALAAGLSRLFTVPGFLIVVTLAVAPVPLLVAFLGVDVLPTSAPAN